MLHIVSKKIDLFVLVILNKNKRMKGVEAVYDLYKLQEQEREDGVFLADTQELVLENVGFDGLDSETIKTIFLDGRAFSHFIEPWLAKRQWYDKKTGEPFRLNHIKGCKGHDFTVEHNGRTIFYDEKTFTQNGCKFMPSSMIGTGRKFNQEDFIEKVGKMNYIIVDNCQFPKIKIKWMTGKELIKSYPKGEISPSARSLFY